MRLRQIALVARDIDQAREDVAAILGLGPDYADPGVGHFGLVNAVWPVGDTFLEVVSPNTSGTTAGRLLEKRGGDGGYMTIFQVDDIERARDRARRHGVRLVWSTNRADGVMASHLHPKDTGGALISVDQMVPPERWEWAGPGWRERVNTALAVGIVGAEIQAEDPDAAARRWSDVLGLDRESDGGAWRLPLDGGEVRIVPIKDGRGEGLRGFDIAVRDPGAVRHRAKDRGLIGADGEVRIAGTVVGLKAV
ncbi:MAG: VOC family protein [Caulobacteraceae bacterium]|nr:VOC family protein [Caulobacteraceae bacterium]